MPLVSLALCTSLYELNYTKRDEVYDCNTYSTVQPII